MKNSVKRSYVGMICIQKCMFAWCVVSTGATRRLTLRRLCSGKKKVLDDDIRCRCCCWWWWWSEKNKMTTVRQETKRVRSENLKYRLKCKIGERERDRSAYILNGRERERESKRWLNNRRTVVSRTKLADRDRCRPIVLPLSIIT